MSIAQSQDNLDVYSLSKIFQDMLEYKDKSNINKIKLINKMPQFENSKKIDELFSELQIVHGLLDEIKTLLIDYFASQGYDIQNGPIPESQMKDYLERLKRKYQA